MTSSLSYAPRLPWHKSPRLRRRLIYTLSLLLLAASIIFLGPRIYHRTLFLYYQHQCMTHNYPPGTIALDIPALPPGALTSFPTTSPSSAPFSASLPGTSWPPAPWSHLAKYLNPNTYWPVDVHLEFAFAVAGIHPSPIFLHRLTSSSGDRLVIAFAIPDIPGAWPEDFHPASIVATIIIPGDFSNDPTFSLPSPTSFPTQTLLHLPIRETDSLRLYTAQPDPADPASFTLTFDLNATRHTARFSLAPAGDQITLTSFTPPL
jgi:hypothetical protein